MRDASPGAFLLQKNMNHETSGWTWKSGTGVFCVQNKIIRKEYENGKDFDSIAAQVADAASRATEGRPDFDLDAISSLYKAFGYEDMIEVYLRIKDSQMQQVALAQLRVLAEF